MQIEHSLPEQLYTAAQTRELDRISIEEFGIPGYTLMQRAGQAAFDLLQSSWPDTDALHIFCGTGNNGGDGFVIAALAKQQNINVHIVLVGAAEKIAGDARLAYDDALRAGVRIEAFNPQQTLTAGLIIDALLGTGLSGEVRGDYRAAISAIKASSLPVLAIDIPSGLCSDTGSVLGLAIEAEQTISFIGLKQGLLTGRGPAHVGKLHFSDLQVPDAVYQQVPFSCQRNTLSHLRQALPPRPKDTNKGHYGHVLIVGGDYGMAGATALAAEAAARTGAGLVSVATRPEHISAIISRRPEIMARAVVSGQELEPLLEKPTVIVIGPGLGRSAWSEQLLQKVLQVASDKQALVMDADALNILSEGRVAAEGKTDSRTDSTAKSAGRNWVLTPHPGEAARLLDCDINAVQADRFTAVKKLQQRYSGVALLKGAGSLIAADDNDLSLCNLSLCDLGNPGMASGGMGDVLSGIIGALLAQGLSPAQATQLGVSLHARAADLAAEKNGERGLLASDLFPYLQALINGKVNYKAHKNE